MKLIEGSVEEIFSAVQKSRWLKIEEENRQFPSVLKEIEQLASGRVDGKLERLPLKGGALSRGERGSLTELIKRLEEFYRETVPTEWELSPEDGIFLKSRRIPFERVGIFIPPWTSAPALALHLIIPARVARVSQIVVASPLFADSKQERLSNVLKLLNIDDGYAWNELEALARFAYGGPGFSPVDRVFAVGGPRLQAGKRAIFGRVGVDAFFGRSEIGLFVSPEQDPTRVVETALAHFEFEIETRLMIFSSSGPQASSVLQAFADTSGVSDSVRDRATESTYLIVGRGERDVVRVINRIAPGVLYCFGAIKSEIRDELTGPLCRIDSEEVIAARIDPFLGPNPIGRLLGSSRFSSSLKASDFMKSIEIVEVAPTVVPKLSEFSSGCVGSRSVVKG